jgi:hypothetical protein
MLETAWKSRSLPDKEAPFIGASFIWLSPMKVIVEMFHLAQQSRLEIPILCMDFLQVKFYFIIYN